MRPTSRKWVMGGFIGLALSVQGWAVDRYVIEGPVSMTVGGLESTIKVTPMAGGGVDKAPHEVEFSNLPTGVEILPIDPSRGMGVAGPTDFRIKVGNGVRAEPLSPLCQMKGDPSVHGSAVILLEKPVSRFVLFPLPRSVDQPKLLNLQIVALDDRGVVVTSYRGDLVLRSSVGSLENDGVEGEQFNKGVAVIPLLFQGEAPVGTLRISTEERAPSFGRTVSARGEVSMKIK
jgi:hypothetical protein